MADNALKNCYRKQPLEGIIYTKAKNKQQSLKQVSKRLNWKGDSIKNINSLCSPDVLWQTVPKPGTIVTQCSVFLGFGLRIIKNLVPEGVMIQDVW